MKRVPALFIILLFSFSAANAQVKKDTVFAVKNLEKAFVNDTLTGKMIQVKGKVFDMFEGGGVRPPWLILSYSTTEGGMTFDQGIAKCYFIGDLPLVQRGKVLTVRGKCTGKPFMYVEMTGCTVLNPPK